jgi:8-oxo-dGTP diphosphatase
VTRLRRLALELFGRLPAFVRRRVVTILSPGYVLGAVLALRHGDDVLMVRSRHLREAMTLPGGLLERGETPREGLVRELREELRLDVELGEDATVVLVYPEPRRVDFVYEVRVSERPELHVDGIEVLEAQWVPITSELTDDTARDALDRLARRPPHPLDSTT